MGKLVRRHTFDSDSMRDASRSGHSSRHGSGSRCSVMQKQTSARLPNRKVAYMRDANRSGHGSRHGSGSRCSSGL